MELISPESLAAPGGHYSHGARSGNLLFVSGQLPFVFDTGEFPEGIEAQVVQAMNNVNEALRSAGASLKDLVNVTIYVVDVADWPLVNSTYASLMGMHKPARAIIPCGPLHHGALIEIAAVAEIKN